MITPIKNSRYFYNVDTSADYTGHAIGLTQINQPYFCMLLGTDNTLTGSIIVEEAVATERGSNFGPQYEALAWVPVSTPIAIAAGQFTATSSKAYAWPSSTGNPSWQTGAEAIRLRFTHTSGGASNQLTIAYFGKSLG
jgi:hypothetical protein